MAEPAFKRQARHCLAFFEKCRDSIDDDALPCQIYHTECTLNRKSAVKNTQYSPRQNEAQDNHKQQIESTSKTSIYEPIFFLGINLSVFCFIGWRMFFET